VNARHDILSVARNLGARLRRSGGEWIGPCPVCGGKDRFAINPSKGLWNCRGCGRGGEVQRPVPWLPSLRQGHVRRRRCRSFPALHLTIFDVALHRKNAARWARLPSKLMVPDGRDVIDEATGKPEYTPVIEFEGRETRDAFSEAVWQRL
jgi:hypothetical protein